MQPRISANRYWTAYAALAIAAVLIAAMALLSLRSLTRVKDTVLQDYAGNVMISQRVHLLIEKKIAINRGYLLTGDSLYLEMRESIAYELRGLLDTLMERSPTEEERRLAARVARMEREYEEDMGEAVTMLKGRQTLDDTLIGLFRDRLAPGRDRLDIASGAMVQRSLNRLVQGQEASALATERLVILVTLASISILLLSSLLAAGITRRLRVSERSVRISQERLDAMVSSAMDAIVAVDPSLRMSLFNRAAERIFRMEASRALGRPVSILLPERARADSALRLDRLSHPGAAPFAIGRADGLLGLRSDGEEFPMEAAVSRTEVEGEVLYTLILRDITGQVEAERALSESESRMRQSQKMEAIGQLAGGIAHDFNNLLTAINGYSELSLAMLEGEHPVRENIAEIRKAGERAANLTRQLLAYSRKQMIMPRVLNLNQVVGNIGRMLRRLIGERYALATRLEPDLELVRVDAGQVEQVLVNLVLNARDAMPDGGRIEIRTRNAFLDTGRESMVLEAEPGPGPYAVLEVADEGVGMSVEVRERIFEPFFTTKSIGKGTGLGLPSVYGIVKQAGGALQVETAPGRGALFRVFLPAVTAGVGSVEETQGPANGDVRGSGETILLAEDEAAVRHFTTAVLESAGYRVVQAADGLEAISLFPEIREDVRLLVTDIVMPGGDGRELAAKLRDSSPGLPVLYMSGYTEAAIDAAELQERGDGFLGKPFSPSQLIRSVREVLHRAALARS